MKMWLLKCAVSVAVLAALMWWADAGLVAERLRGANLTWLATALAALTLLTVLMTRRWQLVAARFGITLPFRRALSEYYISQLVNVALPGGVLGDVGRAVRIRAEGDFITAAQTVAAERVIGQTTMFALMGVAFAVALSLPGGIAWPSLAWLGIAAMICIAAAALVVAQGQSATARFLHQTLHLMRAPHMVLYALSIAVLLIFSLYACARATGTAIPAHALFTLVPLILSSMLIPLSVGGWGWREGAAAGLFPLIGASPGAGIATGIAYGAMLTLAALPALFFWATSDGVAPVPKQTEMDLT